MRKFDSRVAFIMYHVSSRNLGVFALAPYYDYYVKGLIGKLGIWLMCLVNFLRYSLSYFCVQ